MKYEKQSLNKPFVGGVYYETLHDLPIYNWWKISETGDLKLLLKSGLFNSDKGLEIYQKLQQEYLDLFGVENQTHLLMAFLKRKVQLQCELLLYNKRMNKTLIPIVDAQIEQLMGQNKGEAGTLEGALVALGQFMGYRLDPKEVTVVEFKEIINLAEKQKPSRNGGATHTK